MNIFNVTSKYFFASFFPKIISIIILPVILRLITAENWGKISLILIFQQVIGTVIHHGISTRLMNNNLNQKISKNEVYLSYFELLITTLFTLLLVYITNLNTLFSVTFNPLFWATTAVFFQNITSIQKTIFKINEKNNDYFFITFFETLSLLSFQFIFLLREINLVGYQSSGIPSSYFIGGCISGLVIVMLFQFRIELILNWNTNFVFKNIFNKKISTTVTLDSSMLFLIAWSDRFFIKELSNLQLVGIYSVYDSLSRLLRVSLEGLLNLITTNFYLRKNTENYLNSLITDLKSISKYFAILGVITLSFIGEFILPENYTKFTTLIIPLAVTYHLQNLISIEKNYLIKSKKFKKLLVAVFIGLIVNLVLNFFLIKEYSIYGAALATFFSTLIMFLLICGVKKSKFSVLDFIYLVSFSFSCFILMYYRNTLLTLFLVPIFFYYLKNSLEILKRLFTKI